MDTGAGTIFGRQPVLFMTFIQMVIIGACAFGLQLTGLQVGILSLVAAAALSIAANKVVTPIAFPSIPQGTTVQVITPAGEPNKSVVV